jgi:hypothetical protein
MNIRLLRKIERLESSVSQRLGPEPRDAVVSAALARSSTADLFVPMDACETQRPHLEWSGGQVSAGESLRDAMEAECLQAGFKSLAEFDRNCRRTMSPMSLGSSRRAPWR